MKTKKSFHHLRAPEYDIAKVQNQCSWKAFPRRSYVRFSHERNKLDTTVDFKRKRKMSFLQNNGFKHVDSDNHHEYVKFNWLRQTTWSPETLLWLLG